MHIRSRSQTDQRDDDEHYSQRQGKRPKVRPSAIDEKAKNAWSYRRQYEVQKCNDNPKHRTLPGGPLPRPHHVTASSAVPSPEISTNTWSPASGYWIGTMLPVIMIIPRRNGVPAAASLPASQASAFNGSPITSLPLPLPISRPLIESRAVISERCRPAQSVIGVPRTTPEFHTLPATIAAASSRL